MATIDVATKIMYVLGNYDRAFQSIEATTNEEVEVVEAYATTQEMVLEVFTGFNVTQVVTLRTESDYKEHRTLMQMPSDEYDEGIMCQEMAHDQKCREKLIHPPLAVY